MKTIIGIDPGVNTGLAMSIDGKLVDIRTTTFWGAVNMIMGRQLYGLSIYIENPNKNKPIFVKKGVTKEKAISEQLAYNRIAQNVGSNKRDAQLLIDFCKENSIEVVEIKPTKKKVTREYFEKISGWTKPTSQHGRDAAMLILGRK